MATGYEFPHFSTFFTLYLIQAHILVELDTVISKRSQGFSSEGFQYNVWPIHIYFTGSLNCEVPDE